MDGTRARALLGVSAHATPDELRRAFRRRALSTHPDRGGDPTGFDETVTAFRALSLLPAVAFAEPAPHVPFDRYDSTPANVRRINGCADRHIDRPSFADILDRVTTTASAAA